MFRRVVPGQRVHPPAAAMNGLFDLLEQRNRREPKGIPAGFTSGPVEVLVKNNTGSALSSSFSVVALGDVVINRTDGEQAFNRQHLFEGDTPASSSRIAIVQEPLSADAIGRAVVAGITTVKLNVVDAAHTHAGPTTVTTDLTTANSGPAEILWKESGTGSKWAKVLLLSSTGSGGGSGGSGGCCCDESNTEYHPDDNPFDNTFEIRRAFGAGSATTSGLDCRLIGDFVGGRLAADVPDWTHVLICESTVDLRDGCSRVIGSNALTYADGDEVRVPSGASSPRFVVVWCETVNKGLSGPDLYEYKRAYLMRHTA